MEEAQIQIRCFLSFANSIPNFISHLNSKACLGVRQNWRRPAGSNLIECEEHLLLSHNTVWKITGLS